MPSQKSYQEVMAALKPQEAPQELPEELPKELGEFREPPQPGAYRFQVPAALESCFDVIDVAQRDGESKVILGADQKPVTYQRVNLILDGPNALTIVQSPGGKIDGEPFSTRISNIERPRFVGKNVPTVKVSDMTYLLRAKAPEQRPRLNGEFIALALQVLPSQQFSADIEWNGYCNPKNDAYFAFQNEKKETIYEPARDEGATENRKGCGNRIYQSKWPHDATGYAARAQCECGAFIRPFAQLVRFKA